MEIILDNVSKDYGNVMALRQVNLRIAHGEFVALVGPSGSGKTTLLNVCAGLLRPTGGEVRVGDTALYGLSTAQRSEFRRRTFGFIFQTFNLIPFLTARENVELPLYLAGVEPAKQRALAQSQLERVGLKGKESRHPSQLSVGEQQRIAIARALAGNVRILFADEPTGNLDRKNGLAIMELLKALSSREASVVMVTHDTHIAGMAQRCIELVDGGLVS